MTKDYTRIGLYSKKPEETGKVTKPGGGSVSRTAVGGGTNSAAGAAMPVAALHRTIFSFIYGVAALMLLAGLWLILGESSVFPGSSGKWVGFSLIIAALGDVLAVRFLKHIWASRSPATAQNAED